jgi:site-specific recombinase XerD
METQQVKKEPTDDIYDEEKRLESVIKKVKKLKIPSTNKKTIIEFKDHLLATRVGKNKTSRYLYDLINIAEWLDKPFKRATKKDIERIIVILESAKRKDAYGNLTNILYSEWTKRGYRVLLRKFYKWLRGTRYFPDEVDWIKLGMKDCKKKLPQDLFTEEEEARFIQAGSKTRDRALIATISDLGCRVGELLKLRVKDVIDEEGKTKLFLRGKTGSRYCVITFSARYLKQWLNEHPQNSFPDAYIWVKENGERLGYARVRAILMDKGKIAGIHKRIHTHNFRHTKITKLSKSVNDRVLMEYFGIRRAETLTVYTHLSGREVDNKILEAQGLKVEKKKEIENLKSKICKKCGLNHEPTALYCTCGFPLDEKLATELLAKELQRQKADVIMEKLTNNPKFMALAEKFINEDN